MKKTFIFLTGAFALCVACVPAGVGILPGEFFTSEVAGGGFAASHGGDIRTWRMITLENEKISYSFNYSDFVEKKKYHLRAEETPNAGPCKRSFLGLAAPTPCNWHENGFLAIEVNGESTEKFKADFSVIDGSGKECVIQITWKMEKSVVKLLVSLADDDDKLLIEGRLERNETKAPTAIRLRCYPSALTGKMDRWVSTAGRSVQHGQTGFALNKNQEYWIFYYDKLLDVAKNPKESSGPCALLYLPEEADEIMIWCGHGVIETKIVYPEDMAVFHLALWEFKGKGNDEVLSYLRKNSGNIKAQIGIKKKAGWLN